VRWTIHYRTAFEAIAKEMIEVDAPGPSPAKFARLDSGRGWPPIFPLDPEATVP
jgi:microcystin degradation protein MlrC